MTIRAKCAEPLWRDAGKVRALSGGMMTKQQVQAQENAIAREVDRLNDRAAQMRFATGGDCPAAHRLETEATLLWRAWRVQRLSLLGRPEESRALALTYGG